MRIACSLDDVERAHDLVQLELDESFFQVRIGRATKAELAYLAAMASLGTGPYRSGEIAAALGLHLVVEVREASEARERAEDLHDRLELPRVDILAVARDVPSAREHETRPGGAWSSMAWAVPVEYPWTPRGTSATSTPSHLATARLMTSGSFVAPGTW